MNHTEYVRQEPAGSNSRKEKESLRESEKNNQKKSAPTTKIIKYCSFREGSCPFGEKCRFSHAAQGTNYDISKRPIARIEDLPQADLSKAKYARMNVRNVSIARGSTNPAILERIRDTHDDKNHISFARIPLNVYTTRSDVQVSSLSIEDFEKLQ